MRWGAAFLTRTAPWAQMIVLSLSLLVGGIAGEVAAQDAGARITPQAFQDSKVGRTLSYRLPDGSLWGREYWPNPDRTVWQDPDGTCMTCEVERIGRQLCFDCQNGVRSCWQHFEAPGGQVRIVSDAGGEALGRDIGGNPPSCGVPNS